MTLDEFVAQTGLKVKTEVLHIIPQEQLERSEQDQAWAEAATWYESTVTGNGHSVTITTGCGPAHGELSPAEVLLTLADIARDVSNSSNFGEWCEESGRDADSRNAESDYEECKQITLRTGLVCGSQAEFETLMYGTEIL